MLWEVFSLLTGELLQRGQGDLVLPQSDGDAQFIVGTLR
jgi:hypothetical protein